MELLCRMGGGCFMNNKAFESRLRLILIVDFFDAKPLPDQLVIMVNGIMGSPADWRYAAEQFLKKLPLEVIVHRSECNSSKLTFDGVDTMGDRLAQEVLSAVRHWPRLRKISFVAHSFGGLVQDTLLRDFMIILRHWNLKVRPETAAGKSWQNIQNIALNNIMKPKWLV